MLLLCSAQAAAAAGLAAQETTSAPIAEPDGTLLSIVAETLLIGPGGSQRAGRDQAILPPGKTGVLRVETVLPPGPDGKQETVAVVLKVHAERREGGVYLAVDSTARVQPSGEVVLRSGGGLASGIGPLFYEAYVSASTGHRLVFLLTSGPWSAPPPARLAASDQAPRPVAYQIWIYRLTPQGPELLDAPSLGSLVGHAASYSFGFSLVRHNQPPRQEKLELVIRAVDLREGQLTGILRLDGIVGGLPVHETRSWMLPSGATAQIDLQLGEAVGEDLGFRLVVVVSF